MGEGEGSVLLETGGGFDIEAGPQVKVKEWGGGGPQPKAGAPSVCRTQDGGLLRRRSSAGGTGGGQWHLRDVQSGQANGKRLLEDVGAPMRNSEVFGPGGRVIWAAPVGVGPLPTRGGGGIRPLRPRN